jgi:general secretion pathway protein D
MCTLDRSGLLASGRGVLRRPVNRLSLLGWTPDYGRAIALLAVLVIAACTSAPAVDSGANPRHAPAAASKPAGTSPQTAEAPKPAAATTPMPLGAADAPADTPAPSGRASDPLVIPGTGVFTGGAASPHAASAEATPDGDVSFNFVNADVREVVREILGNQLHANYVVDAKIPATMITAQTGGPVPRNAVLPTLESVLRANGLGLVDVNGVYRVVPLEDAAKSSAGGLVGPGGAGYAVRVLPLRFVSATEIKSVLEPFLPPGGVLQADAQRNLLIATGPGGDMEGFSALVRQFDVDWLAGTSFALYPLRIGLAKDVAGDLEPIFGDGGSGPLAGLVRIIPIERLNAILVISPQRGYLAQVKAWIDRLDYGDDQTTPRVFEYRVQNSRAADLAAVLTQLLSSGAVSTVGAQTAPGTKMIDLSSQGAGGGSLGLTTGLGGGGGVPGLGGAGTSGVPGLTGGTTGGLGQPGGGGIPGMAGGIGQQQGTGSPGGPGGPGGSGGPGGAAAAQNLALQPGLNSGTSTLKMPEVRIVADEKNNALVIFARPRDYKMIEDVIKRLDVVPLQVLIEATIAEVTLNNNLQYGLQWFFSHASSKLELTNSTAGTTTNSLNAADIAGIFPGFNYIVGGGNVKAVLSALTSLTDVEVVSAPELLVLDHQSAALQVGAQIPIITQQAQSVITTGAPVVNSVQYLNTGVILQVTPRVNSSGLVTLDIDQSVSDVGANGVAGSPTINQRRVVTSAVVQDGETIALGGLISNNYNNTKNGLPILADIPVLGSLFGTTTRANERQELLVLLTPRIIRNAKEARDMTDDLRSRMRAVKPLESKSK